LTRSLGSGSFSRYVEAIQHATRAAAREKERFVLANLRLVVAIARRFHCARMSLIDLVQEGNIGLMKAVNRYDVRKGYRFATYAAWWIWRAIARTIEEQGRLVRLPALVRKRRRRARLAEASFAATHGWEPSDEELLEEIGLDPAEVRAARFGDSDHAASLDQPFGDEPTGRRLLDVLVDEQAPDPLESVCLAEWRDEVPRMVEVLPATERSVIRRHFGLGGADEVTLKRIGDGMGRSRERVRQIAEQALDRLRGRMEEPVARPT
jgi:RNA polymerase primary sigma factor